jgi:hypothetical protein
LKFFDKDVMKVGVFGMDVRWKSSRNLIFIGGGFEFEKNQRFMREASKTQKRME